MIINPLYSIEDPDLTPPKGVEVIWRIVKILKNKKLYRIAAAAVYVPPISEFKEETTEFLIMSIIYLRSKFFDLKFIVGGDINTLDFTPILDSYDTLRQIVELPTHRNRILDVLVSCMEPLYYPAFVKPPLECDDGLPGEASDHKIVVAIPKSLDVTHSLPVKRLIKYPPLPESGLQEFGRFITTHDWSEVLNVSDVNNKVEAFHNTIRTKYEEVFPEKSIRVSQLDKPWMTPQLKAINRNMKREYWRNRKSNKWKNLKRKFNNLKKVQVQDYYKKVIDEAKETNQSKWYTTVKKLGLQESESRRIVVESIQDLSDAEAANTVAAHFASISQEYDPLCTADLPSYLPAQPPPQLLEYEVYEELKKMKKTKTVLPIDIPYKLRKEFAAELAAPLTDIFNTCLAQGSYPLKWKFEWVTPVPKVKNPVSIKDLRKISGTSDYSKLFERFLKKWITQDIAEKLDPAQFGNQKGTGTDHLLVAPMDKILCHIDNNLNSPLCIATMLDWSAAFDRQCPKLGIQRFLECGVRPEIVPILVSYLSMRSMSVKLNGVCSETFQMPGGGPQGTLLGVLEYLTQSNNNADCIDQSLRFKYVDDLTILELISLNLSSTGLASYNYKLQVPSDIGAGHFYLPASNFDTQTHIETIARWTEENKMQLNEKKSNYMLISRSHTDVSTRIKLNDQTLERIHATKLLGVWITDTLDWELNTRELCKKAYV